MKQRPRRAEAGGPLRSSRNNRNHQRYQRGEGVGEECATQRGKKTRARRQEKSNARLNRRFPLPFLPFSMLRFGSKRTPGTNPLHPSRPHLRGELTPAATTAAWRATASFVAGFREIAL